MKKVGKIAEINRLGIGREEREAAGHAIFGFVSILGSVEGFGAIVGVELGDDFADPFAVFIGGFEGDGGLGEGIGKGTPEAFEGGFDDVFLRATHLRRDDEFGGFEDHGFILLRVGISSSERKVANGREVDVLVVLRGECRWIVGGRDEIDPGGHA